MPMSRLTGLISSRRMHAIGLVAATILVLFAYDLDETPIFGDRALFVYLGQTVLRGESIYATSLFNYLPLGPIVGAGAMWIGLWLGVPTYVAPRYLAVLVVAASVVLTYATTRRASGRAWAGVLAGLVLCGISILARYTVSGLEPKVLVLFFGLIACYSLQRRRFVRLGLACALGTTCWQPFAPVAFVYLIQTVRAGRRSLAATVGRFGLGVLLGILPVAVYLTATGGWQACWRITFVMLGKARAAAAAESPTLWLNYLLRLDEAAFVVSTGLGILWFAARTIRRGAPRAVRIWLHPRLGGVPLATLAWAAWNAYSFDYYPDALPFLWLLGFWTGWLAHAAASWIGARARVAAGPRLARAFAAAALLLTGAYGLADVPSYSSKTTLTEQIAISRAVLEQAGPGATLACIAAEEFYIFDELRSPYPFLRLKVGSQELSDELIRLATGLDGCAGIVERTRELEPVVFVISQVDRGKHECVNRIADMLREHGYRPWRVTFEEPWLTAFHERWARRLVSAFFVYLPPRDRGRRKSGR